MAKDKIEISIEDLKAEVKEFLLEIERDRITPKPVQRIGEIMSLLRRYMRAVVMANAPRDYSPGARNAKQRDRLRAHREACLADTDPKNGLTANREKLKALDCAFVLAGEIVWRIDEVEWEMKLWRPLYRCVERGYEMLYGGKEEAGWPSYISEADLQVWRAEEQEIEWSLIARIKIFWPEGDFPVVDDDEFSVRWKGEACVLGNNQCYRLMKLLVKVRGRGVSHEDIGEALSDEQMTGAAVRKVVERLRKSLRDSPCSALAAWIVTEAGQVRLKLPASVVE